jgi:hypothetical protein
MKKLATWLLIHFSRFQILFGSVAMTRYIFAANNAYAEEHSDSERFSPEQLDNLLAHFVKSTKRAVLPIAIFESRNQVRSHLPNPISRYSREHLRLSFFKIPGPRLAYSGT